MGIPPTSGSPDNSLLKAFETQAKVSAQGVPQVTSPSDQANALANYNAFINQLIFNGMHYIQHQMDNMNASVKKMGQDDDS